MKISLKLFVFLLLSGSVLRAPSSHAQDGAAQAKFISEYRNAEKKIREFYGNATLRANHLAKNADNGKETLDSEILFKGALPFLRIEITRAADARGMPVGRVGAMVVGRSYAFHVVKNPGNDAFALQGGMGKPETINTFIRENGKVFFAPFSFLQEPILDLFLTGDFYVQNLLEEKRDGKNLIKVTWGRRDPATSTWQGWFLFSPEDSWALQEYWFRSIKADYFTRAVLEYNGNSGEIPLVKKVVYQRTGDNGKPLMVEIFEVTEFTPGAAAEREFRLSAFGLPEPAGTQTNSRWYLLFIAIAVLSLGIGGFFWRRVRQQKRRSVPAAAKGNSP